MNNKSIALSILQVNEQDISHFYKSDFNKKKRKASNIINYKR